MGYLRLAAATIAALLALSAPAVASTVSVEAGKLVYADESGVLDEFEVVPGGAPSTFQVYDYTSELQPGTGCALTPDPFALLVITCSGVTEGISLLTGGGSDFAFVLTDGIPVEAQSGEGDDIVVADTLAADVLDGGAGSDVLMGGSGADRLSGGEGDDHLAGDFASLGSPEPVGDAAGRFLARLTLRRQAEGGEADGDVIDGGPGDDILFGGAGPDVLNGGEDSDMVSYSDREEGVVVNLDGASGDGAEGENDTVGGDVENVVTGEGDDFVAGNGDSQFFNTAGGDDVVDLGKGEDFADTGEGDDVVMSRDGRADFVSCGRGRDSLTADARDEYDECEKVDRPRGSGSGGAGGRTLAFKAAVRPAGIRFTGRLVLRRGEDRRPCAGARVLIETSGRGAARKRLALLGSDCRFATTLRLRLKRRATARATFPGTASLSPAQSKRITLRPRGG